MDLNGFDLKRNVSFFRISSNILISILSNNNNRHKLTGKSDLETTPLTSCMSIENYDEETDDKNVENNDSDNENILKNHNENNRYNNEENQNIQAIWSTMQENETGMEFLNENDSNDEKIYEDLCYVTFSSNLSEVNIEPNKMFVWTDFFHNCFTCSASL